VSDWLESPGRLSAGYGVKRKVFRRLEVDEGVVEKAKRSGGPNGVRDFWAAIEESQEDSQVVVVESHTGMELSPNEVGTGISQILPVVVAASAGGSRLVCIEQPELHVHPRVQGALGDLFIAMTESRQFVLETHSEHLLLRLLKRIRQTSEGSIGSESSPVRPTDLSVQYFILNEGKVELKRLRVNDRGDFEGLWPDGFFDERGKELFE